ncbi:hypothetical protein PZB74_22590 [Porifericola rhodea]|uniref:DUF6770 family protein n=1 Tax=Porifericola rhodea TaxID=930972 RepID=UPI002665FB38|nr:DUF6770 family protein [Porifericola rhodea]WKN31738.1 hypothetical protein PZB74_22590 [Porifericola rhodea]
MKANTLTKCLCIYLLFAVNTLVCGQSKAFDDLLTVNLKNMGPIVENEEVRGYYMFYKTDNIDRKTVAYQLRILDQNLNEVGTQKITGSKYLSLLEGTFNGKSIMMKLYHVKDKTVIFHQYDTKGKLISKTSQEVESKYDVSNYYQGVVNNTGIPNQLHAIPNMGFVNYSTADQRKIGYAIEFFPEEGHKAWTFRSPSDSKEIEGASMATITPEMLISMVLKKSSIFSKDATPYIMGLELSSGKKLFEKKLEGNKYSLKVLNSYYDEDSKGTVLFGEYHDLDDKMFKSNSLGMFTLSMDHEGNFTSERYISWTQDVSKFLPINHKGKIDDMGYLYFHSIRKNADGSIYAIAEQYRKAADGVGIAVAALGGGASVAKIVVGDMVFFEFEPDFTLKNVKFFEKDSRSVTLPPGYGMVNTILLGHYVKSIGGFDYIFSQMSKDHKTLTSGYLNYEKRKGEKNGFTFGAISNTNNEYYVDKLKLNTESDRISVVKAKHGYVLVSEYYAKDKKLDMRLEKLNY